MSGLVEAVRVCVRYDRVASEIVSATFIRAVDPTIGMGAPTGTDGAWLSVRDAARREVFRRALPDPATGAEVPGPDATMVGVGRAAERLAVFEVPWPGPGSTIDVHVGNTPDVGLEHVRSGIPLVPRRVIELEAASPPLVVHPIWGADNPNALTLLFLPDGFLDTEMDAFHATVDACLRLFETTEPFASLTHALRAAHVDLPSRTSGIAGTQARDTAFSGHFEEGLDRVILIDQRRALETLNAYASGGSAVAMIVANSTVYGGSGGAAMVFSCERSAAEIALHELGHSAFGLADEYDAAGQSATDQPVEPNVCGFADRGRLKWAHLVPPATPLPTLSADDPVPVPQPTGVGAFEGAKYHRRGRFRAQFDCKMRTLGKPFCVVCSASIAEILSRHQPSNGL